MFEFDPSIDGPTPEHVRWTLVHDCPLRAGTDVSDPDQTERLLRALPHAGFHWKNGTLINDLVLLKSKSEQFQGFDAAKAVAPFGGFGHVDKCCRTCPANSMREIFWAGCFGIVSLPIEPDARARLTQVIDAPARTEFDDEAVPPRLSNRWFYVWRDLQSGDPMRISAGIQSLKAIVGSMWLESAVPWGPEAAGWIQLYAMLSNLGANPDLRITVSVHPAGFTSGRIWQVDPHCGQCKASWHDQKKKSCEICGHQGGRQPSRTRKRIGTRPFRPLEEFIPAEQIPAIIEQWRELFSKVKVRPQPTPLFSRFLATFSRWFRSGSRG